MWYVKRPDKYLEQGHNLQSKNYKSLNSDWLDNNTGDCKRQENKLPIEVFYKDMGLQATFKIR